MHARASNTIDISRLRNFAIDTLPPGSRSRDQAAYLSSRGYKMPQNKVDIRTLKEFALNKLPKDWPLRDIVLSQSDTLEVSTFLEILGILLQLNRLERGHDK